MRLIDADALKKEFPKNSDWNYPVNTNSYVCEKIDEAPTVDAPLWIPCAERLPKPQQKVLVSRNGRVMIDQYLGRNGTYKWLDTVGDYEAWMPLPKAYEGKKNDRRFD